MLLTMKQDDSPYYTHLRELNLSPGWARPEPSMWPSPQPKFKPAVWRFADAKKALDASHNMVPADQTERRNLILVNPIEGNTYATTRHLVAAYQCVMPGDRARTHRHTAAALRLVLHGKEAFTPSSTAPASTCCRARCC
jgi:gentisate 1,2-dioxygenase